MKDIQVLGLMVARRLGTGLGFAKSLVSLYLLHRSSLSTSYIYKSIYPSVYM